MKDGMYPVLVAGYTRLMTENATEVRVTRRSSYRGQSIVVNLRDGGTIAGTVRGWGARMIQLHTDQGYREVSTSSYSDVFAAPAAPQTEAERDSDLMHRAIEADRRERTHWDLYPYPGTD